MKNAVVASGRAEMRAMRMKMMRLRARAREDTTVGCGGGRWICLDGINVRVTLNGGVSLRQLQPWRAQQDEEEAEGGR